VQVCLSSNSPLEKLAVSFSLAQSTKLMVLEARVENTFEKTRAYPQELADTGQISLSQTDVSKLIGQLFIVKSSVNLESDMLSVPCPSTHASMRTCMHASPPASPALSCWPRRRASHALVRDVTRRGGWVLDAGA